ncbi:MAG TPA: ATP-dependent Clp protease proteolytic subunit [Acidimicrobiales bacterium]|nr:ATP-dependent Clp protease proteolytic subunit [Acidimicrobiales bacterium]
MGPDDWTERGDWLEGHMFDRRIVALRGALDDITATRVASQLMTLDATGDDAVQLQLDCPGGSLEAGFAVADVIDALGVPVHVTCLGRVEGSAALVAAVCSRRLAMEHTRFRLTDPEAAFEARASQVESLVEYHRHSYLRYHERLALATSRPLEVVTAACEAGRYLSAAEAVAFGLVDEIVRSPRAPVRALPGLR